ncbi:MAG: phosphotransferase [Pseudomonadota bacterium]
MTDFYALTDEEQARRLTDLAVAALAAWEGDFDEPQLIKYRENAVFSVRRRDGVRAALRVHRHGYHSDAALHSEHFWMSELAKAGIEVPVVLPPRDGGSFVHVGIADVPEVRQVDMLGWLSGAPIGSAEEGLDDAGAGNEELYFKAGQLAAKLHGLNSKMAWPPAFTRHSWNANGLIGENPLWGRFWDLADLSPAERDALLKARAKAAVDLAGFSISTDRYGMIHADFVPENLMNDGGLLKLLDFDDCGFGWYMFELATALYFIIDDTNFAALKGALFEGYRAVRPLSADDEAVLPLFLFLRGTTYLGWIQTRPETQTARELGPILIARTCRLAADYLEAR